MTMSVSSWPPELLSSVDAEVDVSPVGHPQMSNEKRAPGWLDYIEDDTTQLYRDYNKPL